MVFSLVIAFLPIHLARRGNGSVLEWVVTAVAVAVYVALFATAVARWHRQRPFVWVIVGLIVVGVTLASANFLAVIFLWTAASITPWSARGSTSRTVPIVVLLMAAVIFEGWVTPVSGLRQWWFFHVPIVLLVLAAGNVWIVQASLATRELARLVERERIARDLHDVLGHTLSVITLKAELAGWLVTQRDGCIRACAEMAEVERISRTALNDISTTIRGSPVKSLVDELERAAATLRTAGIELSSRCEHTVLDAERERVLCLALREAVTNIVRHANAKTCRVRLHREADAHVLEVQDDGQGGTLHEGQGLRGMRERAEACGGSLSRDASAGTRLTVRLPLAPVSA